MASNSEAYDPKRLSNADLDRIAEREDRVRVEPPPRRTGAVFRPKPLPLTFFDEAGEVARKEWLLKGAIAKGETSGWIAPPGMGKSALLTEISVHVAGGRDWRGHRSKEPGGGASGVVYFAFERADLVRRRLLAHARRDHIGNLPIAVASEIIDLMKPGCVDLIVATVRAAEERFECRTGLLIFDTFAKGIAAGGGDEDKARDQNAVLANLRLAQGETGAHIAIVGHTGKDESRGARGSNAHLGDVDVMVQIRGGDDIKTVEVVKGNDQPEGVLTRFKMESYELGVDEDGDPITTAILSTEVFDLGNETSQGRSVNRRAKLTPDRRSMLTPLAWQDGSDHRG